MAQLTFEQLGEELRTTFLEVQANADERQAARLAEETALEILTVHHPIPDADRRLDSDLLRKDVVYAIPDDALDLVPSLTKAVVAALGGGLLSAVPELVGILYRYRTLRVEITTDEASVLRALRAAAKSGEGALAPAEIRDRLADDGLALKRPLIEVLGSLNGKKTEKVTLVSEVNGRWKIGNV
jgi:hypothetical protein